jgi:hypothetical protein
MKLDEPPVNGGKIQEESMNRKLAVSQIALALLTLAFASAGYAQSNSPVCTDKMLVGSYGFTIQGTKLSGPGPTGPQVGVAMAHFYGNGQFTQIDTVTIGGEVVSDFTHTPANGTYTVNGDCTGTFTITFSDGRPPVTTNFVVVDYGYEIDTVVTSAGGNQGILATSSVGKRRLAKH